MSAIIVLPTDDTLFLVVATLRWPQWGCYDDHHFMTTLHGVIYGFDLHYTYVLCSPTETVACYALEQLLPTGLVNWEPIGQRYLDVDIAWAEIRTQLPALIMESLL